MGSAPTLSNDLPPAAAPSPRLAQRVALSSSILPSAALIPAVISVLVGALLRLVLPDLVTFKFDEATASAQTLQMLRSHTLVSSGTLSSVGGLFPPLFDYLLAPPYLVSASPVVATAYVALLNVLALALSAALVYRYAGPRAAYLTALLYALDAWAVIEARKIWAPYVVALFAVLALWGVVLLVVERRRWGAALALGSWLWLLQLHPSTALLAPVIAAALWLGRAALRPLPLFVGAAAGVVPLLPYLAREQQVGWRDLRHFLGAGAGAAHLSGDALLFPLQNATGLGAGDLQGLPLGTFLPPGWPAAALAIAGTALIAVGIGGALLAAFARRAPAPKEDGAEIGAPPRPAAVSALALLWLAVPTFLALRETTPYFAHYFMALLPVTYIVAGLGLDAHCRQLGRAGAAALVGLTTVYAALSCLPALALYAHLNAPAAASLDEARATIAVQRAVEQLAAPGQPVLLSGLDEDSAIALDFLLRARHPVALTDDSWALLPDAPQDVLIGQLDASIVGDLAGPAARTLVPLPAQHRVLEVVRFAGPAATGGALRPLDVRLANGVRCVAWSVRQPSAGVLRVTLGWHIDALAPGAAHDDDAPYVHLMRGGQMVAQHDGTPYPSARWAAGETLYSWFELPLPNGLPPGNYTLRAGMYTRPAVQRIPRLGPSGQEDGEFTLGAVALPLAR